MADLLKISETTYRRYERNESAPDFKMLEKIAEIHELTIAELLKDDNYTFINTKNKGDNIGNVVINHLSEKLIEQYELRINEQKQIIIKLENTIKNSSVKL